MVKNAVAAAHQTRPKNGKRMRSRRRRRRKKEKLNIPNDEKEGKIASAANTNATLFMTNMLLNNNYSFFSRFVLGYNLFCFYISFYFRKQ
jgi:hypothetical protein